MPKLPLVHNPNLLKPVCPPPPQPNAFHPLDLRGRRHRSHHPPHSATWPAAGPDAASSSLTRARRRKRRRRHPSASADPSPIHTNRRSSQKPPGARSAPTGPGRPALDLHQQDPSARRSICTIRTRPPSFSRHELSKSSWIYPRNSIFHGFLQGMSSIDQSFAFYDLGLGMNGYGLI